MLHCSTGAVEDLFPGLFAGIGGRETETQRTKEKLETKKIQDRGNSITKDNLNI